jgi:Alpha galactosidase C-terminal beta sandwich domain
MSRLLTACMACIALLSGCGEAGQQSGAGPPSESENAYKPPLYWSAYEYHFEREHESSAETCGSGENFIPESELLANIDWVEANLKPYGYDMVAVDGWGDALTLSENGYRASHSQNWERDYAWWSAHLRERGMRLGMYENPLVVHVDAADVTTKIVGTDIPVGTLSDPIDECAFRWVSVDRPGAEQYVKGYIKYYADMGIDHLRVDFISWFENGFDRYLGQVAPRRPRENYATGLRWMREAADLYGMQLSFAMPHLYDEAELERQYAHSVRISEDVGHGEWWKFSAKDRGTDFYHWPQWANAFDGFTHWSFIAGRDRVRLDGDFIRMNTYSTNVERRTVLSTHVMAGGPIAVADLHDTIGDNVGIYQNEELLALNRDGFVGQPVTNDPTNERSQIWTGTLSNGDTIVGLFNRESEPRSRSLSFADVGVSGEVTVRDLWQRAPLGPMGAISVELAPHASMVLQLSPGQSACKPQAVELNEISDVEYGDPGPTLSATASSGLPVQFEVSLGPAQLEGNQAQPTGKSGIVYFVASQPGDDTWCATVPVVGSFAVLDGHQPAMYIGATFTDWAPNIEMQLEGETWVAEEVQIPAGEHEFKFANSQDFSKEDWGDAQGFSGTVKETTGGLPNVQISVPDTAVYRFEFNDITLEYSLELVEAGN